MYRWPSFLVGFALLGCEEPVQNKPSSFFDDPVVTTQPSEVKQEELSVVVTTQEPINQTTFSIAIQAATMPERLSFRYKVTNPTAKVVRNAEVFIAAPIDSPRHKIKQLDVNRPYTLVSDDSSNNTLSFQFSELAPYASIIITVTAVLESNKADEYAKQIRQKSMPSTAMVPYTNPKIQKLAASLKADETMKTVKNSYDWVIANVHYIGFTPQDRGALYALEEGKGDCTEYMYLLAALLRANEIPARLMAGYVYPRSQVAQAADYHNWVEVFLQGEWWVVDSQKQRFSAQALDYVLVRNLDTDSIAITQSQKFLSSQSLTVEMY